MVVGGGDGSWFFCFGFVFVFVFFFPLQSVAVVMVVVVGGVVVEVAVYRFLGWFFFNIIFTSCLYYFR